MISVIVPVYNVEEYVAQCVESLLKQSYTDLEIILVDDGSTDKSGSICEEYKSKDARIVVIHKENGGISDARNVGMDIAKGDYIGFVDSDDCIHPHMYEYLLRALEDYEADVATCGYVSFPDGEAIEEKDMPEGAYAFLKLENREQYLSNFFSVDFTHYVWKSLYKKSLLESLRFAKGKRLEDVMFNSKLSRVISKRVVIKDELYYYRLRKSSTMHANPEIFLELIAAMQHNIGHFKEYEGAAFTQKYVEYVMSYILTKRVERRICGTTNAYVSRESLRAFRRLYDEYGSSQKSHWLARYFPLVYDLCKIPKVRRYLK